jgi:CHAD domain-containing protein
VAYEFGADEPVQQAIIRCATEQLDKAVSELCETAKQDPGGAVHAARKAIKKERSLLRLARGAMPQQQRRRENARLREVARRLSDVRDADVMIAAAGELSERFAGQLPASTWEKIQSHLEARRSAERSPGQGWADGPVVEELVSVRSGVGDWQLSTGGWQAFGTGLVRSYRRGRQACARARAGGQTDDFHVWRKRVKDLWYHERLLAPTCGATVAGHVAELDRLSDLLGDDHDLAVLRDKLTHESTAVAVDLDAVLKLIDHRRAELQTEAGHVGRRVYAEKPKAFRHRMRRAWKAGRELARAPQEQHPAQLAAATR